MVLCPDPVDVKGDGDLLEELDLGVDLVAVAAVRPSASEEVTGDVRRDERDEPGWIVTH